MDRPKLSSRLLKHNCRDSAIQLSAITSTTYKFLNINESGVEKNIPRWTLSTQPLRMELHDEKTISLPTFIRKRLHRTQSIMKNTRGGTWPVLLLYQLRFKLVSYGCYLNGTLTFGSKRSMEGQQNSKHLPRRETATMNIIISIPSMTTWVKEHEVITKVHEKTTGFPRASQDVGSTDELYPTTSIQKKVFNITTDPKVRHTMIGDSLKDKTKIPE